MQILLLVKYNIAIFNILSVTFLFVIVFVHSVIKRHWIWPERMVTRRWPRISNSRCSKWCVLLVDIITHTRCVLMTDLQLLAAARDGDLSVVRRIVQRYKEDCNCQNEVTAYSFLYTVLLFIHLHNNCFLFILAR